MNFAVLVFLVLSVAVMLAEAGPFGEIPEYSSMFPENLEISGFERIFIFQVASTATAQATRECTEE